MMKSSRIRRAPLALLAGGLMWSAAPTAAGESVTGEVVDLGCYLSSPDMGRGSSHKKCAESCIKRGLPMGLLTDDKRVYLLLEDHEKPKPYAQVKGKVAERVTVEG